MIPTLVLIVEGHGEVEAAPLLIRRLVLAIDPQRQVRLPPPIRVKRDRFIRQEQEFTRTVELAALKVVERGAILILLDADEDCPAERGPELLERARCCRPDRHLSVVLANREFESWFLAGARSLRSFRGLPEDLSPPEKPEQIRGAKEWLDRRMVDCRYRETRDQAALVSRLDLEAAEAAPSFRRLRREIERLLVEMDREPRGT